MKRLIRWAVWMYPPAWRRRYQEEFEALLEDLPASPQVLINTLTEGLTMQFSNLGKPAALFALLGAMLAGGASFGIKDEFVATALMQLSAPARPEDDRLRSAVDESLSRQNLTELHQREKLYLQEEKNQSLEKALEKLKQTVRVRPELVAGQNYLAIEVRHEKINVGKAIAIDIASSIRKAYKTSTEANRIHVESGSTNEPVFPNRRNLALAGLAAGCLFGVAFGFIQQNRRQLL